MIGFTIWTIVDIIFFMVGAHCRQSEEAVGFFTFVKPPAVKDVEAYNQAVANICYVTALIFEVIGLPVLFAEQNSPVFIFVIFAVVILVIGMMIAYSKAAAKYRK